MNLKMTLGVVCLAALATAVAPGQAEGDLEATVDALVAEVMADGEVPGISVAISRAGRAILAKGYGEADVENAVPATESTVYRIGSVTKQFTAAAIMLLVERGEVGLDDPVTRFLPDYDTHGRTISVHQLLNHTCGIKGYTEMPEFWKQGRNDLSADEMIELFGSVPLEFEPGEKYQYSNSGYYLLGLIVEKASGRTYEDFLRDEIFRPLELAESWYLDNAPIVPNRAEGYEVRDGVVVNDDPLSMRLPYSAGSLGSSVRNLLSWQRSLVSGTLLSKESYTAMTTPGRLNSGEAMTYGYGLVVGELEGHRKISHGGGINGFRAQLAWYPEEELTVVVLANSGSANPGSLESAIARAALDVPDRVVTEVTLSAEEMAIYAGIYNPGRSPIPVMFVNGELRLGDRRLRPTGDHVFYPVGDDHQRLSFEVVDGRAKVLRLEREGQVTVAPRVE